MDDLDNTDLRFRSAGARPAAMRSRDAFVQIKQLILAGRFSPGERLPVRQLADMLETSRQPIMTAMQQLAAIELVEIVPQVGCIVASPNREAVRDFYRHLARFDALMAELAAERRTDQEAGRLDSMARQIDEVLAGEDPPTRRREYRRLNRGFHELIHQMAHAPILVRLAEGNFDRSDFYMNTLIDTDTLAPRLLSAQRSHHALCRAIRERQPDEARRLMEEHVMESPLLR